MSGGIGSEAPRDYSSSYRSARHRRFVRIRIYHLPYVPDNQQLQNNPNFIQRFFNEHRNIGCGLSLIGISLPIIGDLALWIGANSNPELAGPALVGAPVAAFLSLAFAQAAAHS